MEFVQPLMVGIKQYWFECELILLCFHSCIGDCCGRVLSSFLSAKALHAQLPDMPLRSDTQALRLIASIPPIQRREKCHSREEKSIFP